MARKSPNRPERNNPQLTLFDATRPLILTISVQDIEGAKRKDEMHCAAANAICRQEHVKRAMVCKTKTYVWHNDGTVERFVTPRSLRTEIMIFDRHGEMAGGEYRLLAPKGVARLGHHEKPTGRGPKTGKAKPPSHIMTSVRPDAPKGINLVRALKAVR